VVAYRLPAKEHLDLHGTLNKVDCRAFPLMLTGNARDWFRRLPLGFVDKIEGLGREILGQFMAARMRKKLWDTC
jgi:hypothetical protein